MLSMDPCHGDATSTQESLDMKSHPMKQWSDNVEQIIRETDEAFMAVNFTLTEVKYCTHDWKIKSEIESNQQSMPKSVERNQDSDAFTRHAPAFKIKRKEPNKPNIEYIKNKRTVSHTLPAITTPSSKWSFTEVTDSMTGLFGGRIFGRQQIDDISQDTQSTPNGTKHDTESKPYFQVVSSAVTDEIPAMFEESLDQDKLSFRLKDAHIHSDSHEPRFAGESSGSYRPLSCPTLEAGVKSAHRQPRWKSPTVSHSNAMRFDNSTRTSPLGDSQHAHPITRSSPFEAIHEVISAASPNISSFRNNGFSPDTESPPSRADLTSGGKSKMTSVRPGIRWANHQMFQQQQEGGAPRILHSSPYSMSSPLFRHGSIRLNDTAIPEKLVFGCVRSGTRMDGGTLPQSERKEQRGILDWTTFQMAISSGTGDFLMGGDESGAGIEMVQELDREVDEILTWWDGFGFSHKNGGYGKMIRENPRKKKLTNYRNRGRTSKATVGQAAELPAGTSCERLQKNKIDTSAESYVAPPNVDSESVYESDHSLPDSPMDEISPDVIERGGSAVVMGFNLGHDLPDYLRWETEHIERLAET